MTASTSTTTNSSPCEISILPTHPQDPVLHSYQSNQSEQRGRSHEQTPLAQVPEVHVEDPASAADTQNVSSPRRGTFMAFADRLRSRSRSHSRRQSLDVANDNRLPLELTNTTSSNMSSSSGKSKSSRSRSQSRSRGTEGSGPYDDVIRAQDAFMERLREEEERTHATHNVDGIPLKHASRSRTSSPSRGSRRSSISQALGLEKPLLSF
ncbi:hypothetical protein EMPS_02913 [Entomortierella parvispora]|uniref:Uncharacterized protein n=1 Tax=Entomortierella parvispora TaxID=205924 RepID=A0A9P3H5T4_9FUNG|nr:hypothetical protein EMPS_02913 [Entomortierella parvispora]